MTVRVFACVQCEEELIKWKMESHRCHRSSCYCFFLTSASSVSPKCVLCAHVSVCFCAHKTTEGQRVMAFPSITWFCSISCFFIKVHIPSLHLLITCLLFLWPFSLIVTIAHNCDFISQLQMHFLLLTLSIRKNILLDFNAI